MSTALRLSAFLVPPSWFIISSVSSTALAGLPTVPGFDVSVYATVPAESGPIEKLTFDPDTGALYAGRGDDSGAIFRVPPGGGRASTFGAPIPDPDAVLFDTDGVVSGVPGAVIVGGLIVNNVSAQLWAVLPDEQVISICGPTGTFLNPTRMTFDAAGTLFFADFNSARVFSGAPCPTMVVQAPSFLASIDLDGVDDIYTGAADGVIRVYSHEGAVVDPSFASGVGGESPLQFGPGGQPWGASLYVIDRLATGDLRRYAADGSFEVLGTGFANGRDIVFGPDGAMYVSMFQEHRILRIASPSSCPADLDRSGGVDVSDLITVIANWGGPAGDINGDRTTNVTDLIQLIAAWGPCD